MRNYIYHILAAILFFAGVASIQAQTLTVTSVKETSGQQYNCVSYNNFYHLVSGTEVTVTLEATPPEDTDEIRWEKDVDFFKSSTDPSNKLTNNTHTFQPTENSEVVYCAVFTYQKYKKNEAEEWIPDGEPKTTTKKTSVTFKVYSDPKIENISIDPQNKNTYVGANPTSFTVGNLSNDNGLQIVVDWQEDNSPISDSHDLTYSFTPTSVEEHKITAKVKVYAPDYNANTQTGTVWWEDSTPKSSTINVLRNPSDIVNGTNLRDNITLNRKFSYLGQKDNEGKDIKYEFDVDLTKIEGFNNYKWKYIWKFNEVPSDPSDDPKATFDNPSVAGTYPVTLTIKAYDPDDNNITEETTPWAEISYTTKTKEEDVNDGNVVKVLPAPYISLDQNPLSLDPSSGVTYVNGHQVTVTLSANTNALDVDGYTEKIEWREGLNGTYSESTTDDKKMYIFDPTNKTSGDVTIYAKVSIIGPDNEEWKSSEEIPIGITVLPNPSTIVNETTLMDNIDCPRKYSYDGLDVEYTFSVDLSEVQNIEKHKWHYRWSLINNQTDNEILPKSVNTDEGKFTSTATFTNPNEGTYKVKISVQAYNPNDQEDEWGAPISYDGVIVNVLPNPETVVTEEAILERINRKTSQYSYVGKPGSVHTYEVTDINDDYRWDYEWKLIRDGDSNFEDNSPTIDNNNNHRATFANPDQPGTYKAQLTVLVINPEAEVNEDPWLKKEFTTDDTKSIRVFNNPTVSGIMFGDIMMSDDEKTLTYINNKTDVEVVKNAVDDGIYVIVETWTKKFGTIEKKPGEQLKAIYTAPPYSTDDEEISAQIQFKVGDDVLRETTITKKIDVRQVVLECNKNITYVGDNKFTFDIKGYEGITKYYDNWKFSLSLFVNNNSTPVLVENDYKGDLVSYNFSKLEIPEDKDSMKAEIKVVITRSYLITTQPVMTLSDTITVYKTPTITDNRVTLSTDRDLTSTCVGHARILTADFEYTPKSLPFKIEWYEGDSDKLLATGDLNKNSYEYPPSSVGNPEIKAKVLVCAPDESETWMDASSNPLTINVLEKPEDAVTKENLQDKVIENKDSGHENEPEMLVGHDGETDHDFVYEVKNLDNRYYWTYTWQLLDKDKNPIVSNGLSPQETQKPKFNFKDLGEGTYYVKLTAKAYNKDNPPVEENEGEYWGEQKVTLTNHPITIYKKPNYSPKDYHKNESDSHEYSTYTGVPFDASQLFTSTEGYQRKSNDDENLGWVSKLYVDNELKPMTYTPEQAGDYTLRLDVKNVAPTGDKWFNSADSTASDYTYTLHVYDQPELASSNLSDLFDTPAEGKEYDLHVKSGTKVSFVFNVSGGDVNEETRKWIVKMDINGTEEDFSPDGSIYKYDFQQNETSEKTEYNFNITISDPIDYLVNTDGVVPFSYPISGTITVWKNITAMADDGLAKDKDGYYFLETRVGDSSQQELKIKLVGGDSDPFHDKWKIDNPTRSAGAPTGTTGNPKWDKENRIYTYTIKDDTFTEAGEYIYTFQPKYQDGATQLVEENDISPIIFKVKVWPEPQISQTLALYNPSNDPKKNVSYNEISEKYVLTCFDNDELKMTVNPSGGKNENGLWKYKAPGMNEESILPDNKIITFKESGTISFYNYLSNNTKKKEVKSIEAQITPVPAPKINNQLPTVDDTEGKWNSAMNEENRIDLCGDESKPELSKADFDFSPIFGYDQGWIYKWKVTDRPEYIEETGKWSYTASISDPSKPYENKIITVDIKNSIPASDYQVGENVGFSDAKTYYIRVWHKAELPNSFSLIDKENADNNIIETHAIRDGNHLRAKVDEIQYGYNPGDKSSSYHYEWKKDRGNLDDKPQLDDSEMSYGGSDKLKPGHSGKITYGLRAYNKGPRNTIWAEKTYDPCDVYVYNRPKTPSSLVIKGNGSSGTMIVTYNDLKDDALINSEDYVIAVHYTDANNNPGEKHKPQGGEGDIRWVTGLPNVSNLSDVYAYSFWYDKNEVTGKDMLITSGKRGLNSTGSDENWDGSRYNLTAEEKEAIQALTRAGGGDYTDISSVSHDGITEDSISVYNMNGMMVGTSIKGLLPGMYIIRYQQNGVMRSKKLSVK